LLGREEALRQASFFCAKESGVVCEGRGKSIGGLQTDSGFVPCLHQVETWRDEEQMLVLAFSVEVMLRLEGWVQPVVR